MRSFKKDKILQSYENEHDKASPMYLEEDFVNTKNMSMLDTESYEILASSMNANKKTTIASQIHDEQEDYPEHEMIHLQNFLQNESNSQNNSKNYRLSSKKSNISNISIVEIVPGVSLMVDSDIEVDLNEFASDIRKLIY